jgi:hypothetical protein
VVERPRCEPHRTVRYLIAEPKASPLEQDTVTGHLPADVLIPTFHDQLTAPVALAVFGSSPAAVDGPDLYSTSIEHSARGEVFTFAVAVRPGSIGEVNDVNVTASVVSGGAEGSTIGTGVCSGVAGGSVASGVGTTVWLATATVEADGRSTRFAGGVCPPHAATQTRPSPAASPRLASRLGRPLGMTSDAGFRAIRSSLARRTTRLTPAEHGSKTANGSGVASCTCTVAPHESAVGASRRRARR